MWGKKIVIYDHLEKKYKERKYLRDWINILQLIKINGKQQQQWDKGTVANILNSLRNLFLKSKLFKYIPQGNGWGLRAFKNYTKEPLPVWISWVATDTRNGKLEFVSCQMATLVQFTIWLSYWAFLWMLLFTFVSQYLPKFQTSWKQWSNIHYNLNVKRILNPTS